MAPTAESGIGDQRFQMSGPAHPDSALPPQVVSPDSDTVYVSQNAGAGNGAIAVIDAGTGTVTTTIAVPDFPDGLALSPDGLTLYSANGAGNVSVIDTVSNTLTTNVGAGLVTRQVAVAPDGATVYATNALSPVVSVIDTGTNTLTASVPAGGGQYGVVVSADSSTVYVTRADTGALLVIDAGTNTVTTSISGTGTSAAALGTVSGTATASCDTGDQITGGGFEFTGPFPYDLTSKPVNESWVVSLTNQSEVPMTLTAYAMCADTGP